MSPVIFSLVMLTRQVLAAESNIVFKPWSIFAFFLVNNLRSTYMSTTSSHTVRCESEESHFFGFCGFCLKAYQ